MATNMETLAKLILANPRAFERAELPCWALGLWETALEADNSSAATPSPPRTIRRLATRASDLARYVDNAA